MIEGTIENEPFLGNDNSHSRCNWKNSVRFPEVLLAQASRMTAQRIPHDGSPVLVVSGSFVSSDVGARGPAP